MITLYYLVVAFVGTILSILGKSATLIIPVIIATLALSASMAAAEYEKHSRLFYGITLLLGIALSVYGLASALLSALPILDYVAVLAQGICGLLVTVAEPVIEKLKADG